MEIYKIEVSEEIHDFDVHYWASMKATITTEEDAVEQMKVLRKKIAMVSSSDIQKEKVIPAYDSVIAHIKQEEQTNNEWSSLIKTLILLKFKEDALDYISKSKEWKVSKEAKDIANSLPSKQIK